MKLSIFVSDIQCDSTWACDSIKNKHSLYCGEDCMKMFSMSLREHAADVINFKRKKMLLLTEKELKSH